MSEVIAVVNLKGGTAKTTTAAYLLHAAVEAGEDAIGVDADPQGSLLRWATMGDWSTPVAALPSKSLHKQLPGVSGHPVQVVDTPPLEEAAGIVLSALRLATVAVVPLAPTPIEYDRLGPIREAIRSVADLRPSGEPPRTVVVLTRTVPGAASTDVYRSAVGDLGLEVAPGEVRRREQFAQAFGDPVQRASATAYGDLWGWLHRTPEVTA